MNERQHIFKFTVGLALPHPSLGLQKQPKREYAARLGPMLQFQEFEPIETV